MMLTLAEAIHHISKLRSLPKGWDYGHDGPANVSACVDAIIALTQLNRLNVDEFEIMPGIAGDVGIIAFKGSDSAEIVVHGNGTCDLLFEAIGVDHQWSNLTLTGAIKRLGDLGWRSPRLFVSCTQRATLGVKQDMLASHFETQTFPEAVFLSSVPTVLPGKTANSATTSESITLREYQDRHRSSGEYRSLRYQAAYA